MITARELERRAKISRALKGRQKTAEHSAKVGAALRGRKLSPEHRAKLSEAKIGKPSPRLGVVLSPETRARISTRLKGHKLSRESRARLSVSQLRRWEEGRGPNIPSHGTRPEVVMAAVLLWSGVEFESQYRIGSRTVDFYMTESNSAIEVDGLHWHATGPNKDRDAYLLARGVSFVNHVTDQQLKEAGWL